MFSLGLYSINLHHRRSRRISGGTLNFPHVAGNARSTTRAGRATGAAALDRHRRRGTGGYQRSCAAELGKSVALIDAPSLRRLSAADGEISHSARRRASSASAAGHGEEVSSTRDRWASMIRRYGTINSRASLARANARAAFLDVESAGVEYIRGKAVLADGGRTVCIDGQRARADNILLCTGAVPSHSF